MTHLARQSSTAPALAHATEQCFFNFHNIVISNDVTVSFLLLKNVTDFCWIQQSEEALLLRLKFHLGDLISVSVLKMRGGSGTGVEGTTEAVVTLFGRTATLLVPNGRDNVADLLEIFVKLDTTLSELKQENKV